MSEGYDWSHGDPDYHCGIHPVCFVCALRKRQYGVPYARGLRKIAASKTDVLQPGFYFSASQAVSSTIFYLLY